MKKSRQHAYLMPNIIKKQGGVVRFSRKFGIAVRTVYDWNRKHRNPPKWLSHLFKKFNNFVMEEEIGTTNRKGQLQSQLKYLPLKGTFLIQLCRGNKTIGLLKAERPHVILDENTGEIEIRKAKPHVKVLVSYYTGTQK